MEIFAGNQRDDSPYIGFTITIGATILPPDVPLEGHAGAAGSCVFVIGNLNDLGAIGDKIQETVLGYVQKAWDQLPEEVKNMIKEKTGMSEEEMFHDDKQ